MAEDNETKPADPAIDSPTSVLEDEVLYYSSSSSISSYMSLKLFINFKCVFFLVYSKICSHFDFLVFILG